MEIVSRQQWRAQPAEAVTFRQPHQLKGVIVHWFGMPRAAHRHQDCPKVLRSVQRSHMAGEFADIAYNIGVCQHGVVYELRGFDVQTGANGNRQANRDYGSVVAMIGDGDQFTGECAQGVRAAIAEFRRRGAGRAVRPHGDITGSACPGPEVRAWIAAKGFEDDGRNAKRLKALRKWFLKRKREGRSWAWIKRTRNWAEFKRRGGR